MIQWNSHPDVTPMHTYVATCIAQESIISLRGGISHVLRVTLSCRVPNSATSYPLALSGYQQALSGYQSIGSCAHLITMWFALSFATTKKRRKWLVKYPRTFLMESTSREPSLSKTPSDGRIRPFLATNRVTVYAPLSSLIVFTRPPLPVWDGIFLTGI